MRDIYLNRAIAEAVSLEMEHDEKVILLGEDIINRGGGMSTFLGVPEKYPERCFDMPICESGYTHFANGCAFAGLRPIVDLMFSDFSAIAFDPIVNGAAKFRFNGLGGCQIAAVYVAGNGGRGTYDGVGSGCNHSQCIESWFMNVPGLKIVAPYYPEDALGLMRSSIRDNDPVLYLYHEGSLGARQKIADEVEPIPLNHAAKVLREGSDVTIVAIQSMVPLALKAADKLAEKNISVEIIDPRVLIPFDSEKVLASVKKTGHLLIAQEAHTRGSFAGEILRIVVESCPEALKGPAKVVGALNAPIASGFAEAYIMPHVEDIVREAEKMVNK